MPYIPTEADITWAKSTIKLLADGGVWGCSWGAYVVNKTEKTVTLTMRNDMLPKDYVDDMHEKTIATFKAIGYTVKEKEVKNG